MDQKTDQNPDQQKDQNQISQVFLARQPIFDRSMQVYAYELLFRSGGQHQTSNVSLEEGDIATSTLILNIYSELGFDQVVGDKLAFINLTKNMLMNFPHLPKESVVLELLETITVTEEVVKKVEELSKEGYMLALDDFCYSPQWEPLFPWVKIIKIDLLALSTEELKKHVELLKPHKFKLLAEKIETHEQFEMCKELGFDYFQGYFLSKPKILAGKKNSANKLVVMQLLSRLSDPDVEMTEVEKLLSEDPKFAYKILKIINSAAYAKSKSIESLKQAVIYLGVDKLKEWASLIALNSVEGKPNELMRMTMVRAQMCKTLAEVLGEANSDSFFTLGLFSNLAAIMDMEMKDLLNEMPLSDDFKQAILQHQGVMGRVLDDVIAYEQADWDRLGSEFTTSDYVHAYMSSIDWANAACHALKD